MCRYGARQAPTPQDVRPVGRLAVAAMPAKRRSALCVAGLLAHCAAQVAEGKLPNVFYPNGHANCSASSANATRFNGTNGTVVTGSGCAPSSESLQQMLGTDPLEADWKRAFFGRDDAAAVLEGKHKEWRRLLDGGCVTERCAPLVAAAGAAARQGAGATP